MLGKLDRCAPIQSCSKQKRMAQPRSQFKAVPHIKQQRQHLGPHPPARRGRLGFPSYPGAAAPTPMAAAPRPCQASCRVSSTRPCRTAHCSTGARRCKQPAYATVTYSVMTHSTASCTGAWAGNAGTQRIGRLCTLTAPGPLGRSAPPAAGRRRRHRWRPAPAP